MSLPKIILDACTSCMNSCCKRIYPVDSYELDRHRYRLIHTFAYNKEFRVSVLQKLKEKALKIRTESNALEIDAFIKQLPYDKFSDNFFVQLQKASSVMHECIFYHDAQCLVQDIKPIVCKNFYCTSKKQRPNLQKKILSRNYSALDFIRLKCKPIPLAALRQHILEQNILGPEFLEPCVIFTKDTDTAEQMLASLKLKKPHVVLKETAPESIMDLMQRGVMMYYNAWIVKPLHITYLMLKPLDEEYSEPVTQELLREYKLHLLEWYEIVQ